MVASANWINWQWLIVWSLLKHRFIIWKGSFVYQCTKISTIHLVQIAGAD